MAHLDEASLTCVLSEEPLGTSPNGPLLNPADSTSDRDLPGENESAHRWCRAPAVSGLVLLRVPHSLNLPDGLIPLPIHSARRGTRCLPRWLVDPFQYCPGSDPVKAGIFRMQRESPRFAVISAERDSPPAGRAPTLCSRFPVLPGSSQDRTRAEDFWERAFGLSEAASSPI